MEKITILYAQKLIEELMESSSSSDEDDEMFAVLKTIDHKIGPVEPETPNERNEFCAINKVNQKCNNNKETAMLKRKNEQSLTKKCNNYKEVVTNIQHGSQNCNKYKESGAALTGRPVERKGLTFEDKVMNMISEKSFIHHFRVSRKSAIHLMEKYSLWYCKSPYQGSRYKSRVETNILCYLWFAANETSFHFAAQLFNTTLSRIHKSFNSVLKFMIDELAPEVIKFPKSNNEKEAVAEDFEKIADFPNVLGCVAESYFPLKLQKLAHMCGGSYVYLRAVCDSKSKFLNVKTGFPNEIIDSFMERDVPDLCSPKYHLLGDSKCPIREYLMIPFDDNGNLSDSERNYNIKLIRTHVKIKNAFGFLRNRFRQLKCLNFDTVETMSEFIVSCCVLHNICIDMENFLGEEIYTDVSDRLYTSSLAAIKNDEFLSDLGIMKRFELKHILFSNKT